MKQFYPKQSDTLIPSPLAHELHRYKKGHYFFDEEEPSFIRFFELLLNEPRCFEREAPCHITASAFVLDHSGKEVLLTLHRKLNLWLQLGGHTEGSSDTLASAIREAEEESGITNFSLPIDGIFDIDIHPIGGKCNYHYDVRYLLQAPNNAQPTISEESLDLKFIPLNELHKYTPHRSLLRMKEKVEKLFRG